MKLIYLWLLIVLLFAANGCGPADRGEECSKESSHNPVKCADGLICVWQDSIQGRACAAPGDEATYCDADEDCNAWNIFCFDNTCATKREQGELCVEDRQCKGALVCYKSLLAPLNGHCWIQEKRDTLTQCLETCLDEYYETCLGECRDERGETGQDEEGCDEVCELVEESRPWVTEVIKCRIGCD